MTYSQPARTPPRRISRILVTGLLVVSVATGAALGYQLQASSSSAAASPIDALRSEPPRPRRPPPRAVSEAAPPIDGPPGEFPRLQSPPRRSAGEAPSSIDAPRGERPRPQQPPRRAVEDATPSIAVPSGERRGAPGEADGAVPDGTTVFDDEIPGVAKLDPALLSALRRAATDAANDGVKFYVTNGWRSSKYQEHLLREAISQYGSAKEAARWVATPTASAHVSGDAVDIGPSDATAWLSKHGATYGLCQIYRSEPWHYELRPKAIDHGCPPMYADPTHDPRMRQ